MKSLLIFRVDMILTVLTYLSIGVFVYTKNKTSILNKAFLCFNVFVAFWAMGFFATLFTDMFYYFALLSSRLSHAFAWYCPVFFYIFVINFIDEDIYKKQRKTIALYLKLLSPFFLITIFTPLVIKGVTKKLFFPYYPIPGSLYPLFIVNYSTFFAWPHYEMIKRYRSAAPLKKL